MEIDIDIFKKTFHVVQDEKNINNLKLTHRQGKYYKLFPFSGTSNNIVDNLEKVVSGYIRNICCYDEIKISKDDIIKKFLSNVYYNKDDKEAENLLIKTVTSIFFDENNEIIPVDISLNKYVTCNNNENKVANFIADVLGNKNEIEGILKNYIEKDYNKNVIQDFFIKQLPETKNNNSHHSQNYYSSVVTYIQDVFLEDFEFLINDSISNNKSDTLNNQIVELLEFYYFYYLSQTCLILSKFFDASPTKNIKLYYALDWEKMSEDRLASIEGWKYLNKEISKMFSHAIVLEMLNQNNNIDLLVNYYTLGLDVRLNIDKDYDYSEQIKEISNIYKKCINDCGDLLNNIKKLDCYTTQTESELKYLFECVYAQFQYVSGRKKVSSDYSQNFITFCKKNKIKTRGSLGYILNLTKKDLIFLTKLAIAENKTKRLSDVFLEFERRGVYLDNASKELVVKYYEKLNIIEKKSDSGDALYVKRIL